MSEKKKLELTKEQILGLSESLRRLGERECKSWYSIGRNLHILQPVLKEIESSKNLIQQNLGDKDDKGNLLYVDPQKTRIRITEIEKQQELEVLWRQLIEETVEVELFLIKKQDLPEELSVSLVKPLFGTILEE